MKSSINTKSSAFSGCKTPERGEDTRYKGKEPLVHSGEVSPNRGYDDGQRTQKLAGTASIAPAKVLGPGSGASSSVSRNLFQAPIIPPSPNRGKPTPSAAERKVGSLVIEASSCRRKHALGDTEKAPDKAGPHTHRNLAEVDGLQSAEINIPARLISTCVVGEVEEREGVYVESTSERVAPIIEEYPLVAPRHSSLGRVAGRVLAFGAVLGLAGGIGYGFGSSLWLNHSLVLGAASFLGLSPLAVAGLGTLALGLVVLSAYTYISYQSLAVLTPRARREVAIQEDLHSARRTVAVQAQKTLRTVATQSVVQRSMRTLAVEANQLLSAETIKCVSGIDSEIGVSSASTPLGTPRSEVSVASKISHAISVNASTESSTVKVPPLALAAVSKPGESEYLPTVRAIFDAETISRSGTVRGDGTFVLTNTALFPLNPQTGRRILDLRNSPYKKILLNKLQDVEEIWLPTEYLEELEILDLTNLHSIKSGCATLEYLTLSRCPKVVFCSLEDGSANPGIALISYLSVKEMYIDDCLAITELDFTGAPLELKMLRISNGSSLTKVSGLEQLKSLETAVFSKCPQLMTKHKEMFKNADRSLQEQAMSMYHRSSPSSGILEWRRNSSKFTLADFADLMSRPLLGVAPIPVRSSSIFGEAIL